MSSEINFLNEKILLSLFNFNLDKSKRNKIQKGVLITEVLTSKGFKEGESTKKECQETRRIYFDIDRKEGYSSCSGLCKETVIAAGYLN